MNGLRGRVVNDALGGTPLAIAVDALGNAFVYDRRPAGTELRLAWDGDGALAVTDGRRWTAAIGPGEPLDLLVLVLLRIPGSVGVRGPVARLHGMQRHRQRPSLTDF